jgi:hypothetical protein
MRQKAMQGCRAVLSVLALLAASYPGPSLGNPTREVEAFNRLTNTDDRPGSMLVTLYEYGAKGGRYYVSFAYDTGGRSGQAALSNETVADATLQGDRMSFSLPERIEGGGLYDGRISEAGFDGTWTHHASGGALVSETVHWSRAVIVE